MEPCMRDATLASTWRRILCQLSRYSIRPLVQEVRRRGVPSG